MEQLCTLPIFSDVSPKTQLLFDTLLVIQILDSVYGLIYTACAHMAPRRKPRDYMRLSRVYEPIYTVKNLYNDYIILKDVFLTLKVWEKIRWRQLFINKGYEGKQKNK